MRSLGIDTSNYATSLAVVDLDSREVVCAVKKLLPVKDGELGLRQSDALFHHNQALPALLRDIQDALPQNQLACVGVTTRPRPVEGSYMPCFLAGEVCAQAFAVCSKAALVRTSHQQGHLAAALFGAGEPSLFQQDLLFIHLSGGTTELLHSRGYDICEKLGGSLDLYAGQAVDRLGVALGFGFPAGEQVSALAETCTDPVRVKVNVKGLDCHISGLQNQYEKLMRDGAPDAYVAKFCLMTIAKTMEQLIANARQLQGKRPVLCAGGVMSSSVIQKYLRENCSNIFFAPPALSADNGVGAACIAAKEAGYWQM